MDKRCTKMREKGKGKRTENYPDVFARKLEGKKKKKKEGPV